jgi:GntR family transcriptional repressor for pyruvate dehydrogenase complex
MSKTRVLARSSRVAKVKVTDEIIESLRQDIVAGRFRRGDRMSSEQQLATDYGVSQPTMREALRALEMIGLVEVRHGSGTYVSGHGRQALGSALLTLLQLEGVTLLQVQAVRKILGIESAALAAKTATDEQLQAIESTLDSLDQLAEVTESEDLYQRLLAHQEALSSASNHPLICTLEIFLSKLMVSLQTELIETRRVSFLRARIEKVQPLRRAIFRAISSHSPELARSEMEKYCEAVRKAFEADPLLKKARLSDPHLIKSVGRFG